ncbi:META domain-containing protein [Fulvivirga kasyanovii]|nr:META domain-containing protein [Fulvivirga kasyanovii]
MRKTLFILVVFISCRSTGPVDGQKMESKGNVKKQLSRSWSITSMGGRNLESHKFTYKPPELKLDLINEKLSGFGGCNRLSGTITLKDGLVKFGAISSSRMICSDIDIEQQLLEQLSNKSYQYEIRRGHLVLTEASGNEIIMKGN